MKFGSPGVIVVEIFLSATEITKSLDILTGWCKSSIRFAHQVNRVNRSI